jgi:hypothetical protein
MKFSAVSLLCITPAAAQVISVGVKGGLPFTQGFLAYTNLTPPNLTHFYLAPDYDSSIQRTVPYTIGPAVEIRLGRHIRLEADALYSRVDYDYTSIRFFSPSTGNFYDSEKHTTNQLDFPLLVKYQFLSRRQFQPFIGVGGSALHTRDNVQQGIGGQASPAAYQPYFFTINASALPTMSKVSGRAVVSIGATIPMAWLLVSAEVRYTRLLNDAVSLPALHSNLNQAKILFGISF